MLWTLQKRMISTKRFFRNKEHSTVRSVRTVDKPSTLYRTVRNIANIDRPSFIAELSSVSEFSSVENANQFCDFLRTVLDKHAPPSLRKVITHSSSPWFESIRYELFIAKR